MIENIYEQAQTYLNDYGKVSYSPLATKQIIEGLLAELKKRAEKTLSRRNIRRARYEAIFDHPK